jgi:hypothetical protein
VRAAAGAAPTPLRMPAEGVACDAERPANTLTAVRDGERLWGFQIPERPALSDTRRLRCTP